MWTVVRSLLLAAALTWSGMQFVASVHQEFVVAPNAVQETARGNEAHGSTEYYRARLTLDAALMNAPTLRADEQAQ